MSTRLHEAWERRLKLLQLLLHRGRIATRQAATALSVDRRKAREDLHALEKHGVPVWPHGEGQDREWVLAESWRKIGMQIGFEERLSLLLGRELIESFLHETQIGDAFAKLDQQVEAMTNDGLVPEAQLERRFIYIREPEKDYSQHRETVRQLVEAVVKSHRISFVYHHAREGRGTTAVSRGAPLTLAVYKRGLYIIVERRDVITAYAVERITQLTPHEHQAFDYPLPSEYHPRTWLAERFGLADDGSEPQIVHLRFTAAGRPYAEARVWMPEQEIVDRDDGGCDVIFRATGPELVGPILEFGEMVEVIKPPELRERVQGILTRALQKYT